MGGTTQLCTFHLGELLLGVEVERVQEVMRAQALTRVPLAPRIVSGLMNLRGQIVTAVDLRKRLELAERAADASAMNVVVRNPDGVVAFVVDEIGDVVEVSEESFEAPPETIDGVMSEVVSGVYKLDGQLLLVLDTQRASHPAGARAGEA